MIDTSRRPMSADERARLARSRPGLFGRWLQRLTYGARLATKLQALVELDWAEGVTEVLSIDADAMGFVQDDLNPLHLLESTADRQLVVISKGELTQLGVAGRGALLSSGPSASPLVVERAPHSGILFRMIGGKRPPPVHVTVNRSAPMVLGCELVPGSLSHVDPALEHCTLAALTPERFSLPTPRVVQYADTETAVRPGDAVEFRHWGENAPARVIYVPGVSPQHWGGLGTVMVECEDGSRFSTGDLGKLRFRARGPEISIEPDEVV